MKRLVFLATWLIATSLPGGVCYAQSAAYRGLIKLAERAYDVRHYDTSAMYYSRAFQVEGGKGLPDDRYNAACSWARSGRPDSAFYNLFCITQLAGWSNYPHMVADADLVSLHTFKAWAVLCKQVRANMRAKDPATDTSLADELGSILILDQRYRMELDDVESRYGRSSPKAKALHDTVKKYDAANLKWVTAMLDKHGWMTRARIGRNGITTVFLVLQHADSATQIRYMPMLREAVQKGELPKQDFALYEDRVALRQGKNQIYGSQVMCDDKGCRVSRLADPMHVDERRAAVGLEPLADYVRRWNIVWDAAAFAKQQEAEERLKSKH